MSQPPPEQHDRARVDVGIVTWNTRDLTVDCIRRLLDSDQGADVRVLVHDNASSDGTADAIAERVPEAEVFRCAENLGFARGVNQLIERSDAEWFFTLNSDAWPEPGAIGQLVRTARANPKAAAVAPRVEGPNGVVEHTTQAFPTPGALIRLALPEYVRWRPETAYRLMLPGAWDHDVERDVDWAVGAALLFRRAALDAIGGLDERLFMYGEDLDWCWRAHLAGWSVRFDPAALIRHVGNASGERKFGSTRDVVSLHNSYLVAGWHEGRARAALAHASHATALLVQLARSRPRSAAAGQLRQALRSHARSMRPRRNHD